MPDPITLIKNGKVVIKQASSLMQEAYCLRQQARIENFWRCVDLRYDYMDIEEQVQFNEYLNSSIGQEILGRFVDAILTTSSKRVQMANALLYCKDPEFEF